MQSENLTDWWTTNFRPKMSMGVLWYSIYSYEIICPNIWFAVQPYNSLVPTWSLVVLIAIIAATGIISILIAIIMPL